MVQKAAVEGLLVLNKGAGLSSSAVVQRVRRLLGGVKAGHAGTLDPGAEGVLLVCLGRATKAIPFLAELDKEYVGSMKFGEETDTLDGEGRVVGRGPVGHLRPELIKAEMAGLVGSIAQQPPMYSAVKVGGQRLYDLARQGKVIDRPVRTVQVKEFSLLGWESPTMKFRVRCGSGTYVRSLCHDLASHCGSAGHMSTLIRTAVGPFRLADALSLGQLADAVGAAEPGKVPLLSASRALAHLPGLLLEEREVRDVRHGRAVTPPGGVEGDLEEGQAVRLMEEGGGLVAVVQYRGPGVSMPILRVL